MNDLSIFYNSGDVIELRALGKIKSAVQSGYFKDFKKFEETINILDKTGEHKGIYFVLNKIKPALYARRPDTISSPRESITTTSDDDIESRRWLPIDFDPTRPAEISSTDEEHEAAIQRAKEVCTHLRSLGWPEPILADSGNGAHLIYAIDLPNNESATESVELVLKALDALFSDEKVKIDIKNYNAARIWKAYGTITRKGANIPERPWRRSAILKVPTELRPVPEELLAGLGWNFKQKEQEEKYEKASEIDIEQWLSTHGLDVVKSKKAKGGGRMYVLDCCPWDSSHTDRSAWVVQFPSGAIAAGCHHKGCSGKGWHDLRLLYEPTIKQEEKRWPEPKPTPRPHAIELTLADVADIDYQDDGNIKSIRFDPSRAADAICQYLNIISTPDKKIWVYENGYFRSDGDIIIDQTFDRVAAGCYTINTSKETLKKIYLRTLISFEELDKNPYLLCVKNGVIDLLTGIFSEHSPEYHITMPCPIKFDPVAKPNHFLKFLKESCSNDDDRMTLVDWMIACACLVEFEYVLFLTGHGGNGKHVYEALLQALFGSDTTEAISLDELNTSKFALGYLRRARICISSETNPGKTTTELTKKISGNDWLSSDVKNKDRLRFKAFTQLLFDSNSMPIFDDNSIGFKRRFTRVNMPYEFCDDPDSNDVMQKKADRHLLEKLTTDEELSGILNLIILRAKDIVRDRKIHRREDDFEEYERQSMSVTDFIEEFIEFNPEIRDDTSYQNSSDYLYSKFEEYRKFTIGAGIGRKGFSRLLGKYNEEPSRTIRILGMPVRGFRGLKFDEYKFDTFINEKKVLYDNSIDSNDFIGTTKEIVTSNNSDNNNDRNDVTNITVFSKILYKLISPSYRASGSIIDTNPLHDPKKQRAETSEEVQKTPNDQRFETVRGQIMGKIERLTPEAPKSFMCVDCGQLISKGHHRIFNDMDYCINCYNKKLEE